MSYDYDDRPEPVNLPSSMWKSPDKFTLVCERRDDGGLRVTSPELPGLVLSHHDIHKLMSDVMPAIDMLVKSNERN